MQLLYFTLYIFISQSIFQCNDQKLQFLKIVNIADNQGFQQMLILDIFPRRGEWFQFWRDFWEEYFGGVADHVPDGTICPGHQWAETRAAFLLIPASRSHSWCVAKIAQNVRKPFISCNLRQEHDRSSNEGALLISFMASFLFFQVLQRASG